MALEKIRTIADVECNVADGKKVLTKVPSKTTTLDELGSADPRGQLTTFSGQCEAMHTWFNQKQSQSSGLAVKAGSTGLEKRHVVLQANNKLVLFSRTKESPLSRNAALFDDNDLTKRHKSKFLRNQLNYGNIEQHNVDKACKVESVLDLALLGSARINKNVMDLHLSVLKDKDQEIFSDTGVDDNRTSMVQLSRQDNYAKQSEARELNLYIFGFNNADDGANDALTVRDQAELAQFRLYSNRANPEPAFTQGKKMKLAKHLNLIGLKLKLTLRFETYQEMHECFEHLEKMVERFQTNEYRRARCLHDIQFWTLKMPSYFNLLTSQYQFWLYSSISEELFLKYVDTGDIILFRWLLHIP